MYTSAAATAAAGCQPDLQWSTDMSLPPLLLLVTLLLLLHR
jgi:hypothetical protein